MKTLAKVKECTCGWRFPILAVADGTNYRFVEVTCPECLRVWTVDEAETKITGCAFVPAQLPTAYLVARAAHVAAYKADLDARGIRNVPCDICGYPTWVVNHRAVGHSNDCPEAPSVL
jgi:ribosomal protein S27E